MYEEAATTKLRTEDRRKAMQVLGAVDARNGRSPIAPDEWSWKKQDYWWYMAAYEKEKEHAA